MAERKDATKTGRKANGRYSRKTAASSLTQAPVARRTESNGRASQTQPTADELGLRAWKTTYEKSREGRIKD